MRLLKIILNKQHHLSDGIEVKMATLQEAKAFARKMRRQMTRLRYRALLNTDRNNHEPHRQYMAKVIEFFGTLKEWGFRTTDEDEPGRKGRIVPITEEWIQEQLAKETPLQKLQRRIRNTENEEEQLQLSRELIRRMAAGEE